MFVLGDRGWGWAFWQDTWVGPRPLPSLLVVGQNALLNQLNSFHYTLYIIYTLDSYVSLLTNDARGEGGWDCPPFSFLGPFDPSLPFYTPTWVLQLTGTSPLVVYPFTPVPFTPF